MWSIIVMSPYLNPDRERGSKVGAWVIDSMPPATTTSPLQLDRLISKGDCDSV